MASSTGRTSSSKKASKGHEKSRSNSPPTSRSREKSRSTSPPSKASGGLKRPIKPGAKLTRLAALIYKHLKPMNRSQIEHDLFAKSSGILNLLSLTEKTALTADRITRGNQSPPKPTSEEITEFLTLRDQLFNKEPSPTPDNNETREDSSSSPLTDFDPSPSPPNEKEDEEEASPSPSDSTDVSSKALLATVESGEAENQTVQKDTDVEHLPPEPHVENSAQTGSLLPDIGGKDSST
ncbi:hypothetical protein BDZ91DRAFT_783359 [Kalaharituber pfeilii]|nr:hypothetical protein BDZ91DRAFT_783359 [Kalaharituber pfeilii]